MSRNMKVRANRQHYKVAPDFDSIPNKNWLPVVALLASTAVVVGAIALANNGDVAPIKDKVEDVSSCAQEGLSSLALNEYEITHQNIIDNVNGCAISEGITLTEEQHATVVSTLEATN